MEPEGYREKITRQYQEFIKSGQLDGYYENPEKLIETLKQIGIKVNIVNVDHQKYDAIVIARNIKKPTKGKRISKIRSELTIKFKTAKTQKQIDQYWENNKNKYPDFVLDAYIPVN